MVQKAVLIFSVLIQLVKPPIFVPLQHEKDFRANATRSVPSGGHHPPQQRLLNISHYFHWPILPREGVPSDCFFATTHASKNWNGEVNTNTLIYSL